MNSRVLLFAIAASGFAAMLGQILLLRELLVLFYGHELAVGIILANWLLLVALGSWLTGLVAGRLKLGLHSFVATQLLLAVVLPATVLSARLLKTWLGLAVYDLVDFAGMAFSSFLLLAPLCLLVGADFTLGCRLFEGRGPRAEGPEQRAQSTEQEAGHTGQEAGGTGLEIPNPKSEIRKGEARADAVALGQVYIWEALGSLGGGLLFSYALVFLLKPLAAALVGSWVGVAAALALLGAPGRGGRKWVGWGGAGLVALGLMGVTIRAGQLEWEFTQKQWSGSETLGSGFRVERSAQSRYGYLVVLEQFEQYTFYENGIQLFNTSKVPWVEDEIHYALLQHPHPQRVLLIGGGPSGTLQEILRHGVERVVYVELDPLIVEASRPYLSEADRAALADPRVEVQHLDGRLLVKRASPEPRFDAVIVSLPDPSTAQLNRFYTVEFFREVRRILADDGLLSLTVASGENYLSDQARALNACLYYSLRAVFDGCVILPGETAQLLASPDPARLTADPTRLAERFRQRFLERDTFPEYLTEDAFEWRLTPDRLEMIGRALEEQRGVALNRDFYPICYYYDLLHWAAQFGTRSRVLVQWGGQFRLWWLAGLGVAVCGWFWLRRRAGPRVATGPVVWAIACAGFSGLALEVVLLFVFQALYGYAYYQVGLLITAFMAGLALGGFLTTRALARVPEASAGRGSRWLMGLQMALGGYALAVPLLAVGLSRVTHQAGLFVTVQGLFPALMAFAGGLVGAAFPVASEVCLAVSGRDRAHAGGSLYAADLVGACVGALLVSTLMLPLLGLTQACWSVTILSASAAAALRLSVSP